MKEQALFYKINWRICVLVQNFWTIKNTEKYSKMLKIPFWNGPTPGNFKDTRHSREPPLFIFRLQIDKIFKENVISFGHQSTAVANIEREESEQG